MKKIYVNNREFNGINRIFGNDIEGDSTRRNFLAGLYTTLVRWRLPLVVIYCLLVIFLTQQPFSYTTDPVKLSMHSEPIEWIPFTYVCPVCGYDIKNKVLNLLMLVPFGSLLGLGSIIKSRTTWRSIWLATLYGLLFSLTIEIAQYFLPARTPSASDVVLNAIGSFLGGVLAVSIGRYWYR
jgi:glycopeptide antibiotics resistance protein